MTGSPKRILLVDNDADVLDATKYNLQVAGYQVVTAVSPEEALERLRCEIIHLAIVDIRLQHEDRADDCSGLSVALGLPEYIPCVIYSAYVAPEDIRPLLERGKGQVGAREVLWKSVPEAASQLVEIVNKLFDSEVKVNFELEIRGSLDIKSIATQIEAPPLSNVPQPSADDVIQVFQALFHDAVGIHVTPLLSPQRAPTFTQAGSVLVQARPQFKKAWGAPVAIKFSARDRIEREADNYRLIRPFLGGQRLAVLERKACSRQIGGLVYSLIGAGDWESIRTFSEVFLDEDTETVIGLLERFFSETFEALFADARQETIDLTSIYTKELGLTLAKLQTALEEFHPQALSEPHVRFKGLKGSYINPVIWALPQGRFRHFEVVSRRCLCHGDLHSRNILVDADGHFWLIDFARAAASHALRDFAELETDIKFNLLPVVDLEALLPFEQALLASANFQDAPPDISFDNGRLDHAYQIVLALRRIASDLINLEGDMREYYQALFIHTLNIMRLRHISVEKKEHALLSAALICQRLEDWPDWEPVSLERAQTGSVLTPPRVGSPEPGPQEGDTISIVPGEQSVWWQRLVGTGVFLLLSTMLVALLWWAMQTLTPTWQDHLATLIYLSIFAIILFALLGLISGPAAIAALQRIITGLLRRMGRLHPDTDESNSEQ